MQNEPVIFTNVHAYTNTYMHVLTINERMILKENGKKYLGGF